MQGKLRNLAAAAVKRAAATYDAIRPPDPGIVLLAYHRVGGDSGLEFDLDTDLFDQQMAWLAKRRTVVSLDEAVTRLDPRAETEEERPPASSPVAVTFDDGTADFVDHALPSIVEHGIPVTYYLATEFIDQQRSFPDDGRPLSWAAIEEARSTGLVSFGSHTHSHAVVDKLTTAETEHEMSRSRELLEDRLGAPAAHFAYPKGVFGGVEREEIVAAHYRSAALVGGGVNSYGSTNLLRLRRSPIQRSDGMHYFPQKVDGGMRLEGDLRHQLNRVRYRSAAN